MSIVTTKIEQLDPARISSEVIARAAGLLREGGLVAFPTETVYGLGANALDPAAVARIFAAKGRPSRNPIIVHVAEAMAARSLVAAWPDTAEKLAAQFWPGPLTLVLPRQPIVPDIVTGAGPNVGVRVPAQPIALALLQAAGVPIAAPSANRSNYLSPTTAQHVFHDLNGRIELILDGGPTSAGIESTVLDLSTNPPRILRPGPISAAELSQFLGEVLEAAPQIAPVEGPLAGPGMLARHYSPRARLLLAFASGEEEVQRQAGAGHRVGWLADDSTAHKEFQHVRRIVMPTDPQAYATQLYAALHTLDDAEVDWIVVASVPQSADWAAIRDRLARAAAQ